MEEQIYGLRSIFIGHQKGIRCLTVLHDEQFEELKKKELNFEYIVSADTNGIITVWKSFRGKEQPPRIDESIIQNENDKNKSKFDDTFSEDFRFYKKIEIHEKYVYALCTSRYVGIDKLLECEEQNKIEEFLHVYSGGNDTNVYLFNLNGTIQLVLQGHKQSVCSIVEMNPEILLSGDWNGEVFIWKIQKNSRKEEKNETENKQTLSTDMYTFSIVRTLSQHKHAVYVNHLNNRILTISQDNVLHIWNEEGIKITQMPDMHKQCVRDIVLFNQNKNTLTFSNDEEIRIYDANFNFLKKYVGHVGFIFHVCVNEKQQRMISCGDDKTIKIWNLSDIYELMKNYDISTFSVSQLAYQNTNCLQTIYLTDTIWCVKELKNGDFISACNDSFIRVYTDQMEHIMDQKQIDLFEKKYNKNTEMSEENVNKIEDIHQTVGKEGEIKIFKNKTQYEAYKYENGKWELIGNVINDAQSNKKFYGGDILFPQGYYDELFSIDIGNNVIKVLPYNDGDNEQLIAEKFCKREGISITNIKTIVDFVIQNKPTKQNKSINSYEEVQMKFNPVLSVFTIQKGALDKILQKIMEFNTNVEHNLKLKPAEQKGLNNIIDNYKKDLKNNYRLNAVEVDTILKLFKWPMQYMFPIIDLFRILILNKNCDFLYNGKYAASVPKLVYDCVTHCIQNYSEEKPKEDEQNIKLQSLMLCCLRLYLNMFHLPTPRYTMYKKYTFVIKHFQEMDKFKNENINVLLLKIIFNYIIVLNEKNDNEMRKSLFETVQKSLDRISDAEALYVYALCYHTSLCTYKIQTKEFLNKYNTVQFIMNRLQILQSQKNEQTEKTLKNIQMIVEDFKA